MKLSCVLLLAQVTLVLSEILLNETDTTTNNTCVAILGDPANATDVQNGSMVSSANDLGLWRVAVSTDSQEATIEGNRKLTETSPGAVANVWFDTFTDVDLTDGSNSFSACAYIFKELPYNTMLRGQDDDTSCEQTFSTDCIDAITWRAAETAKWLVANPTLGPYSNLTPPILNPICGQILDGIGYGTSADSGTFPSECAPFFATGDSIQYPVADTLPLTSNVTTAPNCTFYDSIMEDLTQTGFSLPAGLHYPFNATNGSAVASYDQLVDQVWPILTVVFPPANVSRQSGIANAYGSMTCLRAGKGIKASSRVPATLPAAQPVHFPINLSKGAIAGIVIGSVLVLGILAGLVWWLCKKHRKQSTAWSEKDKYLKELSPVSKDRNGVYQLDGKGTAAQLDSTQRAELRGEDVGHELTSSIPPQELDGSTPVSSATKGDDSTTRTRL